MFNKKWHEKHKMPKNPSLKERIKWHKEHQEFCGCRPVPPKLALLIAKTFPTLKVA